MRKFINAQLDKYVLPYVFRISEQPMLYKELLDANKRYNDGMKLEGNIAGMRMSIGRTILSFGLIWHFLFVLPVGTLLHTVLADLDCHMSVILAILFTAFFFGSYFVFKEYIIDLSAQKQIRAAWKNHFPHFDFDKHSIEVSSLYSQAIEQEIANKDVRMFILNGIITDK